MKIWCAGCKTFLGELSSGSKVKKGIVFICSECDIKRKVLERHVMPNRNEDISSMFNDLGIFKK